MVNRAFTLAKRKSRERSSNRTRRTPRNFSIILDLIGLRNYCHKRLTRVSVTLLEIPGSIELEMPRPRSFKVWHKNLKINSCLTVLSSSKLIS